MSVIGWVNWTRKKSETFVFPISRCDIKEWIYGLSVFILVLIALILILTHFTDSTTIVADSVVSSSAATAMWWMARRKLESWYAWTVSNMVNSTLFFIKNYISLLVNILFFLCWLSGAFTLGDP